MAFTSAIIVRPSRILCGLLLIMVGLAFYSLLLLIFERGEWQAWLRCVWLLSLLFALLLVLRMWRRQRTYRLMISGDEMIYSELNKAGKIDESFRLIRLVNRVTWGALLAFRAHDDAGEARQFLIMKDSVSVAGFRRLSVFLRWQKKRH